jgi:FtsZ-binding cell division protein ZapB
MNQLDLFGADPVPDAKPERKPRAKPEPPASPEPKPDDYETRLSDEEVDELIAGLQREIEDLKAKVAELDAEADELAEERDDAEDRVEELETALADAENRPTREEIVECCQTERERFRDGDNFRFGRGARTAEQSKPPEDRNHVATNSGSGNSYGGRR